MIRLLILTSAVALAACAEVESAVDRTGRQAATSAVTETIAINFPQVPKPLIEAFTGCVIDNAQAVEVRELAKDSVVGVDQQTVEVVRSILARPATQNCVRTRATSVL
tara:strand:+ start:377 stop:700 length:324 start_codon:yes stop_codon:yes gene_type:complete